MEKIKAKFDRLIRATRKDEEGNIVKVTETYHFVFGHIGAPISGGFYITKGTSIPDILEIEVPAVEDRT